jgi:hypothetical protein
MKSSLILCKIVAATTASTISFLNILAIPAYSQDVQGGIIQKILLGDISVSNVRAALIQALEKLQETTRTAGDETRKTGDSLEKNGKNIVKEIDEKFGNRADILIRRLDDSERKFMQDVGKTIVVTNQASKELIEGSGKQARLTLSEADILAYNTSYSLPCRAKVPRIVYVADTPIIVGDQLPAVRIRGNFLDQGKLYEANINGISSKVLARGANELTLEIPDSVLDSVTTPQLFQISIKTQQTTYVPLICIPRVTDVPSPIQTTVQLQPQKTISVDAMIGGNYIVRKSPETKTETAEFPQPKEHVIDDNCGINETRRREYLIPQGWSIQDVRFNGPFSTGGSSYKEGIDIYPGKVVVRVRLIGKGYRTVHDPVFGEVLYKDCNGRGWLDFSVTMIGTKSTTQTFDPQTITITDESQSIQGTPGQQSFVVRHSMAGRSLPEAAWRYTLKINRKIGRKIMPPIVLSDQIQTDLATSTTTTMNDGTLSIQVGNP